MSIRLSKIVKDLNVGLSTAVEFLHKKGHADVEANPNFKISEEQYNLLIMEFSKDKSLKIESEKVSQQRLTKEKVHGVVVIEGFEEEKQILKRKESEFVSVKIEKENIPQVKTVGKIDLDSLNKKPEPKKELESESAVVEVVKKEKKKTKPKEEIIAVQIDKKDISQIKTVGKIELNKKPEKIQPKPESKIEQLIEPDKEPILSKRKEVEIFTLNAPKTLSGPKIVNKIDLSSINDKTRPDKKTKEEKRKERDERDGKKKKRNRIGQEKIDITKGGNFVSQKIQHSKSEKQNAGGNKNKFKKTAKAEVSEEDVQKQVKETLARLTEKKVKGAKYRKDKRENLTARREEQEELDRLEDKTLKLTEFVTANDLAAMMNVSINQIIATCMSLGLMVSINQRLDAETINIVAEEFGFKTEFVSAEVIEAIADEEDRPEDLIPRPPIVTVMGHVDHGKTSLLDYIRKANVIAGEAGGITQHIGAYNVKLPNEQRITFLDTPGHEAFTAMRARGAKVTDIAIIIVAADDAVMPQTIEAINHASAAGVPIVFAINKVDKENANPDKIKEALANMNYLIEEWGGKYQSQDISAKSGLNVKELLEKVLLEAELLDLKANPKRKAVGSIIESSLDKGRGYVATILVETGTLHVGDVVIAGHYFGKVKAMFNERNQRITEAGPSTPALILGLNGAPQAGDNIHVMNSESEAREIANKREQLQREQGLRTSRHLTLDEIGRRIALGNFQELNIIVKGDVDGSVEALSDSLIKLSTEEIQVNVIHKAVGAISESDIMLAAASNAIIVGFQVRPVASARKLAEKEEIDIRLYSIIYDAIEEIKAAMEGMLSPDYKEEITATVEVREVFKITKVGTVAGCMVKEGKIKRNSKVRLIRDGIVIYSGELGSLKRFKDDVKEVTHGYECGLNITNYNDIRIGDLIEGYELVEVKKTL